MILGHFSAGLKIMWISGIWYPKKIRPQSHEKALFELKARVLKVVRHPKVWPVVCTTE